jgi:hypothetical protein
MGNPSSFAERAVQLFFNNDEKLFYCAQRLNPDFEGVNPGPFRSKLKRFLDVKKKV